MEINFCMTTPQNILETIRLLINCDINCENAEEVGYTIWRSSDNLSFTHDHQGQ